MKNIRIATVMYPPVVVDLVSNNRCKIITIKAMISKISKIKAKWYTSFILVFISEPLG